MTYNQKVEQIKSKYNCDNAIAAQIIEDLGALYIEGYKQGQWDNRDKNPNIYLESKGLITSKQN